MDRSQVTSWGCICGRIRGRSRIMDGQTWWSKLTIFELMKVGFRPRDVYHRVRLYTLVWRLSPAGLGTQRLLLNKFNNFVELSQWAFSTQQELPSSAQLSSTQLNKDLVSWAPCWALLSTAKISDYRVQFVRHFWKIRPTENEFAENFGTKVCTRTDAPCPILKD